MDLSLLRLSRCVRPAPLAVVASLLVAPAPAAAATFCVGKPACSGTSLPTLKMALDATNLPGNPGPDRVELGEGQFDGPAVVLKGSGAEIVGAGRGKTVIVGKPATWVLVSYDESTRVSDLSIRMDVANLTGIDGNEPGLVVERVDIQGPATGSASQSGIILRRGGTVRDATVELDPAALPTNYGIGLFPDAGASKSDVTIEKVRISAGYAIYDAQWPAPVSIKEAALTAGIFGVGISTPSPQVRLESVAARVVHSGPGDAGAGVGISTPLSAAAGETSVTARHLTLVSLARGGSGLRIRNDAGQQSVRFTGREVLAVGGADWVPATITPSAQPGGDPIVQMANTTSRDIRVEGAATVDLHLSESAWRAGAVALDNASARLADDGGNVDLEHHGPVLVDAAAGNLAPGAGSVLIDNGTADVGVDAVGAARPVDGDGDGVVRGDIGAYEAAPGTSLVHALPYLQPGSCDMACAQEREANRLALLPVTKLSRLPKRAIRRIAGTALRADRITLSIARRVGKRCQALTARQRWAKATKPVKGRCTPAFNLTAKGTSAWSVKLARALPPGRYEITPQGIGASGNENKPIGKRITVPRAR